MRDQGHVAVIVRNGEAALDHFHRATHGASLVVNEQIIVRNAELAARIAVADSGRTV